MEETKTQSSCGNCGRVETAQKRLYKCTRCRGAAYCDVQCQRAHWREHKYACRQQAASQTRTSTTAAEFGASSKPTTTRSPGGGYSSASSSSETETSPGAKKRSASRTTPTYKPGVRLYGEAYKAYGSKAGRPALHGARVGLRNEGNTCYLNGVVQALTYSPLAGYLMNMPVTDAPTKQGFNLAYELAEHVKLVARFNENLAAREAARDAQKAQLARRRRDARAACRDDDVDDDDDDETVREVVVRKKPLTRNSVGPVTYDVSIAGSLLKFTKHAGRMEDAHECLTYLLERLLDACAVGYDGKRDEAWDKSTIVYHLFGLDLAQRVCCKKCGHENRNAVTELMLRLNATLGLEPAELARATRIKANAEVRRRRKLLLKRRRALERRAGGVEDSDDEVSDASSSSDDAEASRGPSPTSVAKLLKLFFAAETLEGYACDKCKERDTSSKGLKLAALPESLALYVDRIPAFGADFGKLNRLVALDPVLDLEPFLLDNADSQPDVAYRLYAIVCHLDFWGSTFFGHYITYVNADDGSWWLLDDDSVKKLTWAQVKKTVNPDLLFYAKCPKSKLPTFADDDDDPPPARTSLPLAVPAPSAARDGARVADDDDDDDGFPLSPTVDVV